MLPLGFLLTQVFTPTLAEGICARAIVQSRPRIHPDSEIRVPTLDCGRSLDLWLRQRLRLKQRLAEQQKTN